MPFEVFAVFIFIPVHAIGVITLLEKAGYIVIMVLAFILF